jgi:hypothetical protein
MRSPQNVSGDPQTSMQKVYSLEWTTVQARRRHWSNLGRKIDGEANDPSIAKREEVSPNHAQRVAPIGLLVFPTISFRLLYGLLMRPAPIVTPRSDDAPVFVSNN